MGEKTGGAYLLLDSIYCERARILPDTFDSPRVRPILNSLLRHILCTAVYKLYNACVEVHYDSESCLALFFREKII